MAKKRSVYYAKLHATTFIPGWGNLSDTLPPAKSVIGSVKMTRLENGDVLVHGERKEVIVPAANIQIMEVGPEYDE